MNSELVKIIAQHPEYATKTQDNLVVFAKHHALRMRQGSYSELQLKDSDEKPMSYDDLAKFCKEYYFYVCSYYKPRENDNPKVYSMAKDCLGEYFDKPSEISPDLAYNLLLSNDGLDTLISQIDFQTDRMDKISDENRKKSVYSDFIHMHPFSYPDDEKITKRLYFDISRENAFNLSLELFKKGLRDRRRVYCKAYTSGDRNDPMLVYSYEKQLSWYLKVLGEIKQEHPEYFEGYNCDILFAAPIMQGVYLADEPVHKRSSFNSQVCDAIDDYIKDKKDEISSLMQQIADANVRLPNGEELPLVDYFEKKIRIEYDNKLRDFNKSIKENGYEGSNADFYTDMYADWLSNRQNPNSKISTTIRKEAERIVNSMTECYLNKSVRIRLQVPKNYNRSSLYAESNKRFFDKHGFINEEIFIPYSPYDDIYKLFDLDSRLNDIISFHDLASYLEKEHISPQHPFLTTESEEEFQKEKDLIF